MELTINGQTRFMNDPNALLLWALRDELGLTGTKFGCGAGICGACTVHVNGEAVRACITPVSAVAGKTVTTIEGLGQNGELHPIQRAFLAEQVPQCAWCMSGQIMTAAAFLAQNPVPTADEIRQAMNRNYCRCGCYGRIQSAIAKAAVSQ